MAERPHDYGITGKECPVMFDGIAVSMGRDMCVVRAIPTGEEVQKGKTDIPTRLAIHAE